MQQAERTGFSPQEARKYVTRLWNQADSGKAFAAAMAAEGWVLAKGDRRDFVLIDPAGETHSLARRIDGAKAAEVRQRMSDIDTTSLPGVADIRMQRRNQMEAGRTDEKEKTKAHEGAPQPITLKVKARSAERDPARPLSIGDGQAPTIAKELAPAPTKARTDSTSKRKPIYEATKRKPESQPKRGPLKKLYTAATDVTQRVYAKARSVFDRKQKPHKPVERQVSGSSMAAPVRTAGTPAEKEMAPKPEASRQEVHQRVKRTIIEPRAAPTMKPPVPVPAEEDRERGRRRDIKPRLSREELDTMIGRQREQREERKGPSR